MGLVEQLEAVQPSFRPPLPIRPPGMTGDDVPLYLHWQGEPQPRPELVFFNVRVGAGLDALGPEATPEGALAAALLSLRIDALVLAEGTWWVLEFHRAAGLAQFGRGVAYPHLLRATYGGDLPVRSAVVSWTVNPFLVPVFERFGVMVWRAPLEGGALVAATPGLLPGPRP